jgi:peptidyl-prolyl cis-trans isomerase B (cyclophilin B)
VTSPQPPGWYADPTGAPQSRYWDGIQWSSSTQPLPPVRPGRGAGAKVALVVGALLGVLVLYVGSLLAVRLLGSSGDDGPAVPEQADGRVTIGPCRYLLDGAPSRPVTPPTADDLVGDGQYEVELVTSAGRIAFTADAARVPCALTSLRSLARQGFYDSSPCHRLTTGGIRVLQCGDPSGSGSGGPGYTYEDEALGGATYPRGTVAMANRGPATNGSQLFLVYGDAQLAPDYTPLGRITAGLDVLDRIASGGSDDSNGPGDGRPRTPVLLERVVVR